MKHRRKVLTRMPNGIAIKLLELRRAKGKETARKREVEIKVLGPTNFTCRFNAGGI